MQSPQARTHLTAKYLFDANARVSARRDSDQYLKGKLSCSMPAELLTPGEKDSLAEETELVYYSKPCSLMYFTALVSTVLHSRTRGDGWWVAV
jgi:hypothetical protein